jgi:hypothetical protein
MISKRSQPSEVIILTPTAGALSNKLGNMKLVLGGTDVFTVAISTH